ncbi:MAG: C39 family peptidase [Akkermansiaceae bacterium]|nr:C39 family peptidase [Akkermansiaceae bacterium]
MKTLPPQSWHFPSIFMALRYVLLSCFFSVAIIQQANGIVIGDRVRADLNLKIRSTASTSGADLGTVPSGSLGVVIGGPTNANGYTWWRVDWESSSLSTGWSVNDLTVVKAPTPGSPSPGNTSGPGPILPGTSVTLTWSSSSGASYYDLGLTDIATGNLVVDTTTTSTSRTVNLQPGKAYRWNVAAGNSAGLSSYTSLRYFQTPQTVGTPTVSIGSPSGNVSVPNGTTSYSFSGSATAPGSSVSAVEWRVNSGNWNTASGTTSWSFTATNLSVGQNIVDVRSRNSQATYSTITSRTITRQTAGTTLDFSKLIPEQISTNTAPHDATLSVTGANLNNVDRVTLNWSGADNGSATWNRNDSNWNAKVTVNSNTSMTLRPKVVEQNPTWSGTLHWTVTLRDTSGATASRSFTVVYTPSPSQPVLSVTPSNPSIQSSSAGSISLAVSNAGGGTMNYSASVASGSSWLSITSGASGGNSGTINVSYSTNTGTQRSGTIQIAAPAASGSPKTVTIIQAGAGGGTVTLPGSMAYIRQIGISDMHPGFDSRAACGPASAVMILTYYNRLAPRPMIGKSGQTNNYSWYVAPINQEGIPSSTAYSHANFPFNIGTADLGGKINYGAHGYLIENSNVGTLAYKAVQYFWKHGIWASFEGSSSEAKVKSEIDAGRPVFLSTQFQSGGHIMAIRGYTPTHLIASDPWVRNDLQSRDHHSYTWSEIHYNGAQKWMIKMLSPITAGQQIRTTSIFPGNVRAQPSQTASQIGAQRTAGALGTIVFDSTKNSTFWNAEGYTWVKVHWDTDQVVGWSAIGSSDSLWIEPIPGSSPPATQYTITATAGTGGTISPSGNVSKNAGGSQTFTASPNANYMVNQWLVDGTVAQTGGNSYTLSNIQANRGVHVTFAASPAGPTILQNGIPVAGIGGLQGSSLHYKITVPSGQAQLVIGISGGTGDGDLYLKRGAQATTTSYDHRPYLNGNNETVTIPNPAAGDWYVMIHGFSDYDGITLTASFTSSQAQTGSLQVNLTPAGAVGVGAQWRVNGGAWQNSGATLPGLPAGSHTLSFKTVDGWTTPANQTVTINSNQTTTAIGTYVAVPGHVDLVVLEPIPVPATHVAQGGTIQMSWTERNNGSASPASTHNTKIFLSSASHGTTHQIGYYGPMGFLSPGASESYSGSIVLPPSIPPGEYHVTVFIDSDQQIPESNENNNIGSSSPAKLTIQSNGGGGGGGGGGSSAFASWASALPAGQRGPNDQPLGDGVPNLVRYALGLASGQRARTEDLPASGWVTVRGKTYQRFTYTRPADRTDIGYIVQCSSNMIDWRQAELVDVVANGNGTITVIHRHETPANSGGQGFMRLRVSQP